MDSLTVSSVPQPVPWYQGAKVGRGIAVAQAALLAWIGGAVFEIAVAMAVKELGLFPNGAPKTTLGVLMGGAVVLAVTLGSLFVGTRLAQSVPPINGVAMGEFDYETLGISAALAAQEHFSLSEFVVGFSPSSAVKGQKNKKKPAVQPGAVQGGPPPPPVPPRGPPAPVQTNPSALNAPSGSPPAAPHAQMPHQPPPPQFAAGPAMSSPMGVSLSDAYGL